MTKYVIGVDYGSDSVRAVLANASNGHILSESVAYYPRWKEGRFCDPARNIYRQHPLDYTETLESVIHHILKEVGPQIASQVVGLSVDTTGSTPVFVNKEGVALSLLPEFAENPNAMFVLWKDHSAVNEADEINAYVKKTGAPYLNYEGGIYSSEWVWAKALHVLREDEAVRRAAYSWIEHCDWIPGLLTGNLNPATVLRGRCSAGHKAMWHPSWGGLPAEEFLVGLDPLLAGYRDRLFTETYTSDHAAGVITPEWAERLGLPATTIIGVGAFDCHFGAVGGGVTPNTLVRIVGTSTCDILLSDYAEVGDKVIPGICGQVDGSVVPGYVGLEAGQSSVGDAFAWVKRLLTDNATAILMQSKSISNEQKQALKEEIEQKMLVALTDLCEKGAQETELIATDWLNGRRTPDANQRLKATVSGLALGTTGEELYRAIVEATSFGGRAIVDRFVENGCKVEEILAIGGIAKKSSFVMQMMADVLGRKIKVATPMQACALGGAMFAAVVGGVYPDVLKAQEAMYQGFDAEYVPNPERAAYYNTKYAAYQKLA